MDIHAGQIWNRTTPKDDGFDSLEVVGVQRFEKEAVPEICLRPVGFGDVVSSTPESLQAAFVLAYNPEPKRESLDTGQAWL